MDPHKTLSAAMGIFYSILLIIWLNNTELYFFQAVFLVPREELTVIFIIEPFYLEFINGDNSNLCVS